MSFSEGLELALKLPRVAREQPMNVAHIKLLLIIYHEPGIRTDCLLPFFSNEKPTLISRINFLTSKKLTMKLPKLNKGGNANPNYYRVTKKGKTLAELLGAPTVTQASDFY